MAKKGNTPDPPSPPSGEDKLLLLENDKGESEPIDPAHIIRADALRTNCLLYYLINGILNKRILNHGLAWLEKQLPTKNFIRVHRRHLINKGYIKTFVKKQRFIKMKFDCGSFTIPKGRWKKVKERFIFIS